LSRLLMDIFLLSLIDFVLEQSPHRHFPAFATGFCP